jgi:hypothetical protein
LQADQDELHFLQRMQDLIEASRLVTSHHDWQAAKNRSSLSELNQKRFPLASAVLRSKDLALLPAVRLTLLREMTCTAVALQRYQLKHGRPPDQIKQLVPAYLQQVPIDYMNGQPLSYRLLDSTHWLLYSVGPNGVDDQGRADDQSSFAEPWIGLDWIWPRSISE